MSPDFANGPWAQALSRRPACATRWCLSRCLRPRTIADLAGLNFDTASWSDVAAAAGRIKATEAALVQAVYANGKVTVNIRRLGQGEAPAKTSVDVPLLQTVGTTYPAAAQAAIAAIEDLWKSRIWWSISTPAAPSPPMCRWIRWTNGARSRPRWPGVDNVTSVQVMAMDIGYARLSIAYQGNPGPIARRA